MKMSKIHRLIEVVDLAMALIIGLAIGFIVCSLVGCM